MNVENENVALMKEQQMLDYLLVFRKSAIECSLLWISIWGKREILWQWDWIVKVVKRLYVKCSVQWMSTVKFTSNQNSSRRQSFRWIYSWKERFLMAMYRMILDRYPNSSKEREWMSINSSWWSIILLEYRVR